MKRVDIPEDAKEYLTESYDKLDENDIKETVDYLYNNNCSVKSTLELRKAIADKTGVHLYTVNFVFLVCASERMLAGFRERNIDDEIFWDTIMDLQYKLYECKKVHGVWGNFVENWYDIFYKLDIVKLGRLEYERMVYPDNLPEVEVDGFTVKPGDTVYSTHIPSAGKFSKDLREDSYARAKEFFKAERGGKPVVLFCESWLMNPDHLKIFPETMNIVEFQKEWKVYKYEPDGKYHDCWRTFSVDYDGDPDKLPQETGMQKCIVKWLKDGNVMGAGYAVKKL